MADEQNPAENSGRNDQIFSDLLKDSRLSSLQIEEPEFDSFDVQSVIRDAKTAARTSKPSRIFGKRSKRLFKAEAASEDSGSDPEFFSSRAERHSVYEPEYKSVSSALEETQKSGEAAQSVKSSIERARAKAEDPVEDAEETKEISAASLFKSDPIFQKKPAVDSKDGEDRPKTFVQLLNSSQYRRSQQAIQEIDTTPILASQESLGTFDESDHYGEEIRSAVALEEKKASQKPKADPIKKAPVLEEEEFADEEVDEAVYDPSASLVNDYHYDEYEDKKHFSTTDYKKIEEYLNRESAQGFHYTRNEGNKYYFLKARPHNYYYRVLYFAKEPTEEFWNALDEEGWRRVDRTPSRHKKDAGWYIVRNEKKEGELPREIENEEEKYRYFSKLSSSCRSTMFLLFIVMVCSAVAVWLQYEFKGYPAVMAASAVLFFVALWIFLVYARILAKARKQASLLSARIRLAENDPNYQALLHAGESDEDLDKDWNDVKDVKIIGVDEEDDDDDEDDEDD